MTDSQQTDCIIVGAGSAGAALAGRLAQRGLSVRLLDAGPAWSFEECPPQLRHPNNMYKWDISSQSMVPPGFMWEGQLARRVAGRDPAPYMRGRGLGGSSTVNGCYAIRPPMQEFDDWAAAGCAGWSSDDVLDYFVRLERDVDFAEQPYHGDRGPTPITRVPQEDWGSIDDGLRDAALSLGHPWRADHNAPGAHGVSLTASNIENLERVTTNDSYLEPERDRQNLLIVGGAHVDTVLVRGGQAVGVQALVDGEKTSYFADEVIVSAGAIMTPAILQRSGIGPAALLDSLGIDVVENLPVGVGIQDHAGFELLLRSPTAGPARSNRRRGNCTLRLSSGLPESRFADLLITDVNVVAGSDMGALLCKLALNQSRGRVSITTRDPEERPQVDFNLLSDEHDVALARYLIRHAIELSQVGGFPPGTTLHDVNGHELPSAMDGPEIDAWARSVVRDTAHAASGCAMGAPDDSAAVLDTECRVRGVGGLRVADTSVMPTITRANTHLPAVMIGERVADWVTRDHGVTTTSGRVSAGAKR